MAPPPPCLRCGTCCTKGGPALHRQDLELVRAGVLEPRHLVTLRRGEPAFHPVEGRVVELPQEMIKVRGRGGWRCLFLTEERLCSIHRRRPLECRALKCWDTREIEALFLTDLLTRSQVIASPALLEIVEAYDRRLPAGPLCRAILSGASGLKETAARDREFRRSVARNFGLHEVELEFYLGRSVESLLEQLAPSH